MPAETKDAPLPKMRELSVIFDDSPSTPAMPPLAGRISASLGLVRVARLAALALVIVTTTFFLISSFTFSWINIVQNVNVLWISQLAENYSRLYWAVLVLNALTLVPAFYRGRARWCVEALLLVLTVIGMLLSRVYRLYDVQLSSLNLVWSVAVTLPLLCFGIHDIVLFGSPGLWRRTSAHKELALHFAFLTGATVGAWYFVVALLRYPALVAQHRALAPVLAATVLLHGCLFAGVSIMLGLIAAFMRRQNISPRVQFLAALGIFWIFASLLLRRLVTPALSFNSAWADVWSWIYPLSFIVMLAGWQVRRSATLHEAIPGLPEEILSGLLPPARVWTALVALAAFACAFAVPYFIERVDWNFLFQRSAAIAVWIAILVAAWRVFARPITRPAATDASFTRRIAALLALAICSFALAQSGRLWRAMGWRTLAQANTAYSGMDASFQVAQLALRPVVHDGDRTGLFPFLRKHSLMAEAMHPPQLTLAAALAPVAGAKPDIYIIVVDTMRRDYLSPYNPRVSFAPRIAQFAAEKDSFVFQHAYTNYGGTALSEPAIWAGAMIPSKQYVEPFYEYNALEQLTTTDGYHRLLLRDMILNGLLRRFPDDRMLSIAPKNGAHFGLDLRDEVHEIVTRPELTAGSPLFVYAQPQNLHPITLHELANHRAPIEGSYPGFNARYADELRKVDAAFGALIDDLKAKGRYENSIVVLTADHGDWLGEYGRWGHGQSLLPAIIDVPLLIHLPAALAKNYYCNPQQTVFLTDITPTLYYLLGHRDLRRNEFFGRPLFTATAAEQEDYSERYHLIMSSYAAVFAVLDGETRTLYVADAVDDNQAVYRLSDDWYGLDNLIDAGSQAKFETLMRGSITRLNAMYGAAAR